MVVKQDLHVMEVDPARRSLRESEVCRFVTKRAIVGAALVGTMGLGILPAHGLDASDATRTPAVASGLAVSAEAGETAAASPPDKGGAGEVVDLADAELVHHVKPHLAGMRCGWRIGWWHLLRRGGASTAHTCWYLWQHALAYRW